MTLKGGQTTAPMLLLVTQIAATKGPRANIGPQEKRSSDLGSSAQLIRTPRDQSMRGRDVQANFALNTAPVTLPGNSEIR